MILKRNCEPGCPIRVGCVDRQRGSIGVGIVAHIQDLYIPAQALVVDVVVEVADIQHAAAAVGDHGLVEGHGQRRGAKGYSGGAIGRIRAGNTRWDCR